MMKNKGIVIFLLIVAVVIVIIFVIDYRSGRPGKSAGNPFALDIEAYKTVDPVLVNYTETRNLRINLDVPSAINVFKDTIYLAGDNKLLIIDPSGNLLKELTLDFHPVTFEVTTDGFYLASTQSVYIVNKDGQITDEWEVTEDAVHITALAIAEDHLLVADAGNRKISRYTLDGDYIDAFDGKADEETSFGFIVPGPQFDLAINSDNELWVVNPGLHALENYSFDGRLRGHWEHAGVDPVGFSGCCNPAHIAFLSDGRFITSEKGLVRIKTYKPSGELDGVVAAPVKFNDNGQAPDIAADSMDNIYALDYDRKTIRMFVPVKEKTDDNQLTGR